MTKIEQAHCDGHHERNPQRRCPRCWELARAALVKIQAPAPVRVRAFCEAGSHVTGDGFNAVPSGDPRWRGGCQCGEIKADRPPYPLAQSGDAVYYQHPASVPAAVCENGSHTITVGSTYCQCGGVRLHA